MPLSTQLILTGTDLYWKDRIEEKRKEWKSKKEADKKGKEEQKRALEMQLLQEIATKKKRKTRDRKGSTFFTVKDTRSDLYKKRKV